MRVHIRMLVALIALFSQGCERDRNCEDIRNLIEVESTRVELLNWADENVFSKKFDWMKKDFQPLSSYTGPGKRGVMINVEVVGIKMPKFLSDYYLWSIGPDETMPDAIFFGKNGMNYKGIVVTKSDFRKSLQGEGDLIKYIDHNFDRIGILCVNRN